MLSINLCKYLLKYINTKMCNNGTYDDLLYPLSSVWSTTASIRCSSFGFRHPFSACKQASEKNKQHTTLSQSVTDVTKHCLGTRNMKLNHFLCTLRSHVYASEESTSVWACCLLLAMPDCGSDRCWYCYTVTGYFKYHVDWTVIGIRWRSFCQ